jgi:hypothetical protein
MHLRHDRQSQVGESYTSRCHPLTVIIHVFRWPPVDSGIVIVAWLYRQRFQCVIACYAMHPPSADRTWYPVAMLLAYIAFGTVSGHRQSPL